MRTGNFAKVIMILAAFFYLSCRESKSNNQIYLLGLISLVSGGGSTAALNSDTGVGTATGNPRMAPGSVVSQGVSLTGGTEFYTEYSATRVTTSFRSLMLARTTASSDNITYEVTIVDENGIEVFYSRSDSSGKLIIRMTPTASGNKTYSLIIKNTSSITFSLSRDESKTRGGTFSGTVDNANLTAKYKDYTLKGFVSFSSFCYAQGGSVSNTSGTNFFPQAFVSMGKVDATTKKVTDVSSANITLKFGDKSVKLLKLDESNLWFSSSSMTAEQKAAYIAYIKLLYSGYYGMIGELYTTPSDCSTSFNLGTDPGKNLVTLSVNDTTTTPVISQEYKFKPTVAAPLEMFENDSTTPIRSEFSNSCVYHDDNLNVNNYAYVTSLASASTFSQDYVGTTLPIPSVSVVNSASTSATSLTASSSTTQSSSTTAVSNSVTVDLPTMPTLNSIVSTVSGSVVSIVADVNNVPTSQTISVTLASFETLSSNGYDRGLFQTSLSYNSTQRRFVGTYTIPSYVKPGQWIISRIGLRNDINLSSSGNSAFASVYADYSYNKSISNSNYTLYTQTWGSNRTSTYSSASNSGIAFARFTVTGTVEDKTAPTLESIAFDKTAISLSGTSSSVITITINAKDDSSGIRSIWGTFGLKGSGFGGNSFNLTRQSNGSFTGTVTLNSVSSSSSVSGTTTAALSGTYQINSLSISDNAGNQNTYSVLNACRTIDSSAPPKLKVTKPSGITGSATTTDSDPTRAFFWGYSQPKSYWTMWRALGNTIQNGTITSAEIDGCFFNGGIVGVPISASGLTDIPASDLNAKSGDIVSFSSFTGTSTLFRDFYQGNVDLSGNVTIPTNTGVANSSSFTLTLKNCIAKADSSMAVSGIYLFNYGSGYNAYLVGKLK